MTDPIKGQTRDRAAICAVVRAGAPFTGKQGFAYAPAISAQTVSSSAIHMQLLTIPLGGRAKAHKHEAHETAIYVLAGAGGMYFGPCLEQSLVANSGEFLYIPANVPHLPYNTSQTEPCIAVVARTDSNEQESVILLPELDGLRP